MIAVWHLLLRVLAVVLALGVLVGTMVLMWVEDRLCRARGRRPLPLLVDGGSHDLRDGTLLRGKTIHRQLEGSKDSCMPGVADQVDRKH